MTQILVIEDEGHIRDNIAEILEYERYEVLKAAHGVLGIQLAQDHLPDLIMCDIMMPGLSGIEVLQELQIEPATASIPFIFLTAKSDRESVRIGMDSGADDYLTKPCTSEEIIAAVNARLAKRETIGHEYEQHFDALRGNLITVLPHELRTPLTGIMGYAELLQMSYETLDKAELGKMVDEIALSGQRLHHVIENYLLYAQTEIFRHDTKTLAIIHKQQTDFPGTLIREVAMGKAKEAGRTNDLSVYAEDVPVRMSTKSLKKLVEELVDNALKFSAVGTMIDIVAEIRDGLYKLRISDQGRGMTIEQVSRVGAYMQFERKLYEQQGMGLGLILAKSLTELHQGRLTIQSAPSKGTTVFVELLALFESA
jgi:two-component system, sensor histidine kinase and response regulator